MILTPSSGENFFQLKSYFGNFWDKFGLWMTKKYCLGSKIAYRDHRKCFWQKNRKFFFWLRKFSLFRPSDPESWVQNFFSQTFSNWSFSQLILQPKSFNLRHKAVLRDFALENCGRITKKLRSEFEFYDQNHIFF